MPSFGCKWTPFLKNFASFCWRLFWMCWTNVRSNFRWLEMLFNFKPPNTPLVFAIFGQSNLCLKWACHLLFFHKKLCHMFRELHWQSKIMTSTIREIVCHLFMWQSNHLHCKTDNIGKNFSCVFAAVTLKTRSWNSWNLCHVLTTFEMCCCLLKLLKHLKRKTISKFEPEKCVSPFHRARWHCWNSMKQIWHACHWNTLLKLLWSLDHSLLLNFLWFHETLLELLKPLILKHALSGLQVRLDTICRTLLFLGSSNICILLWGASDDLSFQHEKNIACIFIISNDKRFVELCWTLQTNAQMCPTWCLWHQLHPAATNAMTMMTWILLCNLIWNWSSSTWIVAVAVHLHRVVQKDLCHLQCMEMCVTCSALCAKVWCAKLEKSKEATNHFQNKQRMVIIIKVDTQSESCQSTPAGAC